jgi:hypothetical protein
MCCVSYIQGPPQAHNIHILCVWVFLCPSPNRALSPSYRHVPGPKIETDAEFKAAHEPHIKQRTTNELDLYLSKQQHSCL